MFISENDLQADLIQRCKQLMAEEGFPQPFNLSSEIGVTSPKGGRGMRHDLVLGLPQETDERVLARAGHRSMVSLTSGAAVVVEVKFEPIVAPGSQRRRKELGTPIYLPHEPAAGLAKLAALPDSIGHRHFVFLDEKGWWRTRLDAAKIYELCSVDAHWVKRQRADGVDYWLLVVELPPERQIRETMLCLPSPEDGMGDKACRLEGDAGASRPGDQAHSHHRRGRTWRGSIG